MTAPALVRLLVVTRLIHDAVHAVVQLQPVGAVTCMLYVPPLEVRDWLVGEMADEQVVAAA